MSNYPYYERDGTRVFIDHFTPEGKAKMEEIWSIEYRRVAEDYVGDIHVSTVFLPINHAWTEERPILFETMVFGYDDDDHQWRYATEEEALAGHAAILEAVQKGVLTRDVI